MSTGVPVQGVGARAVHLSATLMTWNSAKTLPACLARLGFCDEIVVVDDFSTDGTWEWLSAQQDGRLKIFQHRLTTFAEQRRFLQHKAAGQWLLIVDADEEVSPELAEEILAATHSGRDVAGYSLRLRTYAPPFWKTRPWYDVFQKRLLRADRVSWPDSASVHAPAEIRGPLGRLAAPLWHSSFDSGAHFMRKQLAYAGTVAIENHARGRAGTFARAVLHGAAAFVKYYFLKGLIRFGAAGAFVAFGLSAQHFLQYFFLWERAQGLPANERPAVPGEARAPSSAGR